MKYVLAKRELMSVLKYQMLTFFQHDGNQKIMIKHNDVT